ncbi:VWA domain-containing protein [Paenibacillus sp. VCA1]|uniref:VWA domain-containing protein n=1 Tax=Paenibacillus sp. VCA1 TaxID=3039148 RepID=UPI0037CAEADA
MLRNKNGKSGSKIGLLRTKLLILVFACCTSVFYDGRQASAESVQKAPPEAFDAMFVLDTSYSMNHADPNRSAGEVIRLFMDISDASRTRVGFVAYNHQIVASKPLTAISVAAKKNEIKSSINGLRRSGYTDLGLGLLTGSKLLSSGQQDNQNIGRKPFMILLSDGETDFGPFQQKRTKADSAKDVGSAIAQAKKSGFPIYTIGLNHDGTVNTDELKRIASETGGTFYITSSADDLPEIFNRIFAKEMRSVLMPVAGVTATGNLQEIQVDIPNSSMDEANMILLSEHPLKESQLFYNSENIRMFKSASYTLIKISQPQKGTAKLKFRGTPGDLIKINLLGSYALEAKAALTEKEAIKGKPAGIEAFLVRSDNNQRLGDAEVYASLKTKLVVKELASKKVSEVEMKNEGTRFYAEYAFPKSGTYEWHVEMDGPSFYRHGPAQSQKIVNLAPEVHGKQQLQLTKEDGKTEVLLDDLFTDPNGDPLTYGIQDAKEDGSKIKAELSGGKLMLSPLHTGQSAVTLTATDPEGGQATAVLTIHVQSKYTVLKWSLAGAALLLVLGTALYFWLRPKPALTGKLEGYFLATASGSEIPVKYWPLTSFAKRKVSLMELFQSLDVNEPLPEAEHIVFTAAKNGRLIVKHTTRCALVRNRTPLKANKKEILEYNDKLYITFEDGITEIEIRYKAIKPSTNIFIRTGVSGEKTG